MALVALAFLALAGRAVYLQVFSQDFLQRQGESRYARTLDLPASRGEIHDRNGVVLASSLPARAIFAVPGEVDVNHPRFGELARRLGLDESDLRQRISGTERTFIFLRRQLDPDDARQVLDLKVPGVHSQPEYKRRYPEGDRLAHIVGFTNVEDSGQEGIELAQNKLLAGRPGSRRVIRDRLGRVIEQVEAIREPLNGNNIALSIDAKVQYHVYSALRDAVAEHRAQAGGAVVLDVRTGEVLALVNLPTYDPNQRGELSGAQLRNRVLTDTFEPGSTMKAFAVAAALEQGLVQPETMIQTAPGRMMLAGSTISDAHPQGLLSVSQVIQKSSNVGTVKMAMQLPARDMWEYYARAGFGQKPQLPFPGAVSGRLRPYKTWRPIEQATMSYGYGLSVSLFQLAHAYTVFARDGDLAPASLLKVIEPVAGVRVFSEKNALAMRQMLHSVTQPGGTAQKAQTIGYSVGGKTGTTHKQEGKGYATNKYRGFFVGLAPVEKPRIVVAVMIDEPGNGRYYGGDVAAPVFAQTVQQTLRMMGLPPDVAVKPQIIAKAAGESF
jgi:cell division protein FtsI (penicillin-binding protein 3)